jgi:hypothetical protein
MEPMKFLFFEMLVEVTHCRVPHALRLEDMPWIKA